MKNPILQCVTSCCMEEIFATYWCVFLRNISVTSQKPVFFIITIMRTSSLVWLSFVVGCLKFIHSAVCLMAGPQPLPKRVLHRVWCSASTFNFQYPLISVWWSSSCQLLLPRLPVTSVFSCHCFLVMCFGRQFCIAFLFCIVCRIFLASLTLCDMSSFITWSVQLIFSITTLL